MRILLVRMDFLVRMDSIRMEEILNPMRIVPFINRQTLISLRTFINSITPNFFSFFRSTMSQPSDQIHPQFDPSQPSMPLSYPIKSLQDLESRAYFSSFHFPFNKASVSLSDDDHDLPNRARILVCHDMAGGYLEDDKWIQGGSNAGAYGIWHWYLIDVFVYFSHNLVTLPPPGWINAAHKHGVKVLGTFITEWEEGRLICDKLLSSKDYAHMCAERLAELATALGFDGWLINMEVGLSASQVANLKEFVSHLTNTMHVSKPGSLVIWYDSVTVDGDLSWQDQLNDKNKAFFDLCDGIFTNYTWREEYPKRSAEVAGDRKFDVYTGIDVFGRNTYGGGQWNTNVALDVIKKSDVSAAIFAPGWVYETNQPPNFPTAQNRWWDLVEKSWGLTHYYLRELPFYSNFDQGHGHHISLDGRKISNADWCNLSCQSFQPYLEFYEDSESDSFQVRVDPTEESYDGGGNVTFRGDLGYGAFITRRLFQANLLLGDLAVQFSYSVKTNGDSLLGLVLYLTSPEDEKFTVLLAPLGNTLLTMNQFSSKFSKVLMPVQSTELELAKGWILLQHHIAMPGYTLTAIYTLCYKLRPHETRPNFVIDGKHKSQYYAVLGNLLIHTPGQYVLYPPASSWLVEANSINWEESSNQSKSVSLSILWKLTDPYDLSKIQKYYIYAEKISEDGEMAQKLPAEPEYLGVSFVSAFYVSDFLVPSGTQAINFYIQVCGIDGTRQELVNCPLFVLEIEG